MLAEILVATTGNNCFNLFIILRFKVVLDLPLVLHPRGFLFFFFLIHNISQMEFRFKLFSGD